MVQSVASDSRTRSALVLPATLWATCIAFSFGAAAFAPSVVATPHADVEGPNQPLTVLLMQPVIFAAFATVGAVVASRRPRHPVGWILLAAGWLFALAELGHGYAHHALRSGAHDAGLGPWSALVSAAPFMLGWGLVTIFLPLLFPDGKLLSARWKPVAWVGGLGFSGVALSEVFKPGPFSSFPEIANPTGLSGGDALLNAVAGLSDLLWAAATLSAGVAVVLRFVRSAEGTRQQFKWVALPAVLLVAFIALNELWLRDAGGVPGAAGHVLYVVALGGLPIGVGIAVLRYRLYEIDRIISRTLAYALLTLVLVGVYAAAVVGLGTLLRATTVEAASDVTVAASTLLVAALFQPVRRRIQRLVDRRFNRARYDAQRTIDGFGQRLRDEVELSALVEDMHRVVVATVQPEHVSLWLRPAEQTAETG